MNSNNNSNKKSANCEQSVGKDGDTKTTKDDNKTSETTDRRQTTNRNDDEMRRVYIRPPPNRHVHDIKQLRR